ncbi:MAG: phage integrase SAM-like domain-containing protein [Pirellulaceae bacterium]
MASVTTEKRNGKVSYRISWTDGNNKRQRIRLSRIRKQDADQIASKIQAVSSCQIAGIPLDPSLARWVGGLGADLRSKLERAGLIEARPIDEEPAVSTEPEPTFIEFIDAFIKNRKDAAQSTKDNWNGCKAKLESFFGSTILLREIDRGDADDWRQSMVNAGLAKATISKNVKICKQFAKAAVRKGFADENPFHELVAGGEKNTERQEFIDRNRIQQVIDAAPNDQWKLIIALSRYGGLRCPSETLGLRWEHINWEKDRFTVFENKTKTRVVPIFPELRPYLEKLFFNDEQDDSGFVITLYRSKKANLRTQLLRIIAKAGVPTWPRLFHNLRASRETELSAEHPIHVVCAWLGNSEKRPKITTFR